MKLSEELQWRGFVNQMTFDDISKVDTPRKFYFGVDPSADSMQIGNLAAAMMVRLFMEYGHEAYLLVGGATGMIGDPDGRKDEREIRNADTVAHNVECISAQYRRVFEGRDFHGLVGILTWSFGYARIDYQVSVLCVISRYGGIERTDRVLGRYRELVTCLGFQVGVAEQHKHILMIPFGIELFERRRTEPAGISSAKSQIAELVHSRQFRTQVHSVTRVYIHTQSANDTQTVCYLVIVLCEKYIVLHIVRGCVFEMMMKKTLGVRLCSDIKIMTVEEKHFVIQLDVILNIIVIPLNAFRYRIIVFFIKTVVIDGGFQYIIVVEDVPDFTIEGNAPEAVGMLLFFSDVEEISYPVEVSVYF